MALFSELMDTIKRLASEFEEFTSLISRFGMEYFRRFYGPYRALVEDNKDPAGLGRVTVSCPRARLLKDNNHWLFPMAAGAGTGHGEFFPPEKGDAVWIFFDNGDVNQPACYLGGWYHGTDIDKDLAPGAGNAPAKRGWVTKGGSKVYFDDTDGSETIFIKHKSGKLFRIQKDKISVGSKDGTFEPMVLGKTLKQWLDNHTHPHAYGPTQKPLQPLPDNALSKDTETT